MDESMHDAASKQEPPLGLIAGNGSFPCLLVDSAVARGFSVVVAYHSGETEPQVLEKATASIPVRVGQLGKISRFFRHHGVQDVVFLGGIRRSALWKHFLPDRLGLKVALQLPSLRDDGILRNVATAFEALGFKVLNPVDFLSDHILSTKLLTNRSLSKSEWKAAMVGWEAAKKLGAADKGQTVVVKDHLVVAQENFLGTDSCIRRSKKYLSTGGGVVVKLPKPQQDRRVDLPAIGPKTITLMQDSGCSALILEMNGAILSDVQEIKRLANSYGIAIMGFESLDDLSSTFEDCQI
ncbi:LpxI family protein [bacterium]|nr:LpxI family protein [bacterium]